MSSEVKLSCRAAEECRIPKRKNQPPRVPDIWHRCAASLVIFALLSVVWANRACADEPSDDLTAKKLDAFFRSYADAGQLSGTVLVAANGNVYLQKGYGLANREWNIPNDLETRISVASLSKVFTAHAAMVLVEQGKVDLDKPIGEYLPGLRPGLGSKVTLHHLLSHSSGVKRETFEHADEYKKAHESAEILEAINNGPLVFDPGSKTSYSNAEYTLLALIVEKVSGQAFANALQTLVFGPAKMNATGFGNNARVIEKRASGYDLCVGQPVRSEFIEYGNNMGASGIYTTVGDLLRFDSALRENRLISAETQALMRTPHSGPWGYGWRLLKTGQKDDGSPLYAMFHNGDTSGFSAHFMRLPEDQFVFGLLSNQNFLPRDALLNGVSSILNGGEASPPRKRIDEQLFRKIVDSGPEAGLKFYEEVRKSDSRRALPRAMRCLQTGNMLLRLGRDEDARDVFTYITKAYPRSPLGYLALGRFVQENDGNQEAARKMFEKVLTVDPTNAHAKRFLTEIE